MGSKIYRFFVAVMILGLLGVFHYMDLNNQDHSSSVTVRASESYTQADVLDQGDVQNSSDENADKQIVRSLFAQRILDQFNDATVIDSVELLDPDGIVVRKEVILTEMKYPLIRREIHFQFDKTLNEWFPIEGHAYVADQVLMGLKAGETMTSLFSILDELDAQVLHSFQGGNHYLIKFKSKNVDSVEKVMTALRLYGQISYVEPNFIRLSSYIPNDSRFHEQWALHNEGRSGGRIDADIDAVEAWDLTLGEPHVIVAVIDSGIDSNHPDLVASIYHNPSEQRNGRDDDSNGLVDDVSGWNFAASGNGNNDTTDTSDSHGTHVSGTIAARGDNNQGVVGVCPNARILPVKVLDEDGGYVSDFVKGIDYAVQMGAAVINISLGGSGYSQSEQNVFNRTEAAGVLVVVASGNDGINLDISPDYPTSYPNANIISVLATNRLDQFEDYSNYGASSVDLAAPGSEILSTYAGNKYRYFDGTSMSAPHVAGVAALIKSVSPGWTAIQVKEAILTTVDLHPSLNGKCITGGRVNAQRAVNYAMQNLFVPAGSQIAIRSNTNLKYVIPEPSLGNRLLASSINLGTDAIFYAIFVSPGRYAFRSYSNGLHVSAQSGGEGELATVSNSVGNWEIFKPIMLQKNLYAFRANANGRVVTAESAATAPLIANRDVVGGWEAFIVEPIRPLPPGSKVVLQAGANGRFVSLNASGQLVAQATVAGSNSIFTVGLSDDGYITLQSQAGLFVSADEQGAAPLIANRDAIGDWEKFLVLYHGEKQVVLRAKVNNKLVSADNTEDSILIANRTEVSQSEVFYVSLVND